jgi:hypothetical protein
VGGGESTVTAGFAPASTGVGTCVAPSEGTGRCAAETDDEGAPGGVVDCGERMARKAAAKNASTASTPVAITSP